MPIGPVRYSTFRRSSGGSSRGRAALVACGGAHYQSDALLALPARRWRGTERPRISLLPTAAGRSAGGRPRFYERLASRAEVSHVALFRRTIADLRAHLLAQDVIFVSGGNTASMLAVWRAHGVDAILREAWEQGIVLAGIERGRALLVRGGVTDSYGPSCSRSRTVSASSAARSARTTTASRSASRRTRGSSARAELAPGHAADDHVALHFAGTELAEIVAGRGRAGPSASTRTASTRCRRRVL